MKIIFLYIENCIVVSCLQSHVHRLLSKQHLHPAEFINLYLYWKTSKKKMIGGALLYNKETSKEMGVTLLPSK
jgi:hypothetical protein